MTVNNYKDFNILPYLEANKLACHNIIYTGKRHETPGSDTAYFIKAQHTSWAP